MNFSKKMSILILIVITALYVYSAFFYKPDNDNGINKKPNAENFYPQENNNNELNPEVQEDKTVTKNVKIYILDKNGKVRSVNRTCTVKEGESCFEFAIAQLLKAPSKWEKSKNFTSEIPSETKILSVRESSNSIMIDLSKDFEYGGGTESTFLRVIQLIKTANANTNKPVYLFINGKQVNVIGGDGIMIKQPLNESSING